MDSVRRGLRLSLLRTRGNYDSLTLAIPGGKSSYLPILVAASGRAASFYPAIQPLYHSYACPGAPKSPRCTDYTHPDLSGPRHSTLRDRSLSPF